MCSALGYDKYKVLTTNSGIAIFLATLNLLLGILTLSYLHPKKDGKLQPFLKLLVINNCCSAHFWDLLLWHFDCSRPFRLLMLSVSFPTLRCLNWL